MKLRPLSEPIRSYLVRLGWTPPPVGFVPRTGPDTPAIDPDAPGDTSPASEDNFTKHCEACDASDANGNAFCGGCDCCDECCNEARRENRDD